MQLRKLLSATVGRAIPRKVVAHVQRVLFMGSLYVVMSRKNEADDQLLEEANEKLQLVPTKDGLKMSAALKNAIWRDRLTDSVVDDIEKKLSQGSVADVCQKIADLTPRWLCYTDGHVPMEDIKAVMEAHKAVGLGHR